MANHTQPPVITMTSQRFDPTDGDTEADRDIELAFSGGGMRAAAFALGTFLYFVDVKLIDRIRQISSVSGGSITNGFIANRFTSAGGWDDTAAADLARRLTSYGVPLEQYGRQMGIQLLLSVVVGLVVFVLWLLGALRSRADLVDVVLYLLFIGVLVGLGSVTMFFTAIPSVVAAWFADITNESVTWAWRDRSFLDQGFALFSGKKALLSWMFKGKKLRTLREIDSPMTHVFTSTDLRNGEHFHFSQKWATSNTYGSTDPGDVRIYEAVNASAAFPGALAPVNIKLSRLSLPIERTVGLRHLQLVDGGVRDNLGHMFQTRLLDSDSQRDTLTQYGKTKLSVVVDASAPRGVEDLSQSVLRRIPVLRHIEQFVTFPRVLGIMNQSNSEARSLALAKLGHGVVVIRIIDSPVELCSTVIDNEDVVRSVLGRAPESVRPNDSRKQRAQAVLEALVRDNDAADPYWKGIRNQNQQTATTLADLGADRVAALIRHGYVLTMCHAHIEYEWPLPPDRCWSADRFASLVDSESFKAQADSEHEAMTNNESQQN